MSIASEITRLQGCKADIRTALVNKGVSGASSHDMADFATDITSISAGGATITVTYSSTYYNKTITCTKGATTYTTTTTSSGSTTFNVTEGGTWTISCNGSTSSADVVLAYSVGLRPDGKTVTPVNDVQTWLKCADIGKSYTTINQVLADSTTLLALMSDNNAVDYLVRSTSWTSSITGNSTAMTDIGANNYCASTLLANATWSTAICNSAYFESVLNTKVPTMTSATTPSGEVITSGANAIYPAWKAFDGNTSSIWLPTTPYVGSWVGYIFTTGVSICKIAFYQADSLRVSKYKIQAHNGSDWIDIGSEITMTTYGQYVYANIPYSATKYTKWRLYITDANTPNVNEIQFYGRASS